MHPAVGKREIVHQTLNHLYSDLSSGSPSVSTHVAVAYGLSDPAAIQGQVSQLAEHFGKLKQQIETEVSHDDVHFVSRCDLLGIVPICSV